MMRWQDPKTTVVMTCCLLCTPHNIVNTGPPIVRASLAACKYHLIRSSCKPDLLWGVDRGRITHFLSNSHSCKMKWVQRLRSTPRAIRSPSIVIFTILAIGGDEAPAVRCRCGLSLSMMLWELAQQVTVKRYFHFYAGSC